MALDSPPLEETRAGPAGIVLAGSAGILSDVMRSVPPALAGGSKSQSAMHTGVINPSAHADGTDLMTQEAQHSTAMAKGSSSLTDRAYSFADLSAYSLKDRWLIRAADLAFFVLIKLIGRTVKFDIEGWENWQAASRDGGVPIHVLWHDCIYLAIYFWRRRGVAYMTSRDFER